MKAIARIDVRLVPNMGTDEVIPKIKKHLEKRGFSEVEIRALASYPWGMEPVISTDHPSTYQWHSGC